MAAMFGDEGFSSARYSASGSLMRTWDVSTLSAAPETVKHGAHELTVGTDVTLAYYDVDGNSIATPDWTRAEVANSPAFATGSIKTKDVTEIKINPDTFPGTYYITGDRQHRRHAI